MKAYMKFVEEWSSIKLYEGLYETYRGRGER